MLYEEASKAKVPVSLATVYNTCNQFTDVGLLRQVAVDGSKTYFDTTRPASPFLLEGENGCSKHPDNDVVVGKPRSCTEGYEIAASTWWSACAARAVGLSSLLIVAGLVRPFGFFCNNHTTVVPAGM